MVSWTVGLHSARDIPHSLRHQFLALMRNEWPQGFCGDLEGRDWIHPDDAAPLHLCIEFDGSLQAACSLMHTNLAINGERFPINGISGFIIHPAQRGTGLGGALLDLACHFLRAEGRPISVLSCSPSIEGFYQSRRFSRIQGMTVRKGDPNNPVTDDEPLMARAWNEQGKRLIQRLENADIYFGPYTW